MKSKALDLLIVSALALTLAGVSAWAQQTPPTATVDDSLAWDYADADAAAVPVAVFLVCLDAQPTAACARVPATGGVAAAAGVKTYKWKFPAMTPGTHTAVVQACTANAAECSGGAPFAFVMRITIPNPTNLRTAKSGGA